MEGLLNQATKHSESVDYIQGKIYVVLLIKIMLITINFTILYVLKWQIFLKTASTTRVLKNIRMRLKQTQYCIL